MKVFYFLIILTLVAASCKKNYSAKQNNSDGTEIEIGQSKKMFIKSYSVVLDGSYLSPDSYFIDLNDDGIDDIKLRSEIVGSPGMGTQPQSFIHCLHDEVFLCDYESHDNTYYYDTVTYLQNGAEVWSINNITYSCYPFNPNDPVYQTSVNDRIRVCEEGESISENDIFNSVGTRVFIYGDGGGLGLMEIGSSQDTVFHESITGNHSCYSFPQGEYKYIGVKLVVDGLKKFGWIKLKITSDKIISLEESAIHF